MSKVISTAMPISKAGGIKIDYSLKCHRGNYDDCSKRSISHIVMHYTGNAQDTAKGNANYFHNSVPETSAHYFVDDNSIYQSVDLCDIAWHAGDKQMNAKSIGIEMACTAGNFKIGKKAITNSVALVAELCKLLGIKAGDVDKYVIRHYDVIGKICPAQMAGAKNAEWLAFKAAVKAKLEPSDKTVTTTLRELRRGMKGNDVQMLKVMLKAKGYYKNDPMHDKTYGANTEKAVRAFKKDNGLADCDVVGAATWKALLKK